MRERWEALEALRQPLLDWYESNRRVLPWREEPSPYRTWVSEIMLQQTRVSAVLPYFERLLRELPDPAALAAVSEERLFKLWEGLGYYSRARNLRRAAQKIMEDHGGELPRTLEELHRLPGIGDYTAAAIASIHFGVPAPAVDGNLLRVTARLCGSADDVKDPKTRAKFQQILKAYIDSEHPGKWNQAMMDLGATVCLPNGAPRCAACPGRGFCAAYREGLTETLPVRGEKKKRRAEEYTVFLLLRGERLAVRTRPDTGLLAGLTEFPNTPGSLDEGAAALTLAGWGLQTERLTACGTAKHIFTHVEWQMKGYAAEVSGGAEGLRWVDAGELAALAIPSAFRCFTKQAKELLSSGSASLPERGGRGERGRRE